MTDNELRHYGVPGMKWGQRRSSSSSSGGTPRRPISTKAKVGIAVGSAAAIGVGVAVVNRQLKKHGQKPIGQLDVAKGKAATEALFGPNSKIKFNDAKALKDFTKRGPGLLDTVKRTQSFSPKANKQKGLLDLVNDNISFEKR